MSSVQIHSKAKNILVAGNTEFYTLISQSDKPRPCFTIDKCDVFIKCIIGHKLHILGLYHLELLLVCRLHNKTKSVFFPNHWTLFSNSEANFLDMFWRRRYKNSWWKNSVAENSVEVFPIFSLLKWNSSYYLLYYRIHLILLLVTEVLFITVKMQYKNVRVASCVTRRTHICHKKNPSIVQKYWRRHTRWYGITSPLGYKETARKLRSV